MGCGPSLAKTNFDFPAPGPLLGSLRVLLVSPSHLYCLTQHVAEWPDYYTLVDCRSRSAYNKGHIVNAQHVSDVTEQIMEKTNEFTVIVYGDGFSSPGVQNFLNSITSAGSAPTALWALEASFGTFKSKYRVVMSSFRQTQGEQPGPIELLPATRENPAIYTIHRNQFQHCKTTIAYLGCTTVINISSRRLFLKTAAIQLENIQFDSVNEPYDEAINAFNRYVNQKPRQANKGNVLIIDETNCDYGALLVGWFWFSKKHDLEKVCELLTNKMGELDPWYLDVLRAWAESPPSGP